MSNLRVFVIHAAAGAAGSLFVFGSIIFIIYALFAQDPAPTTTDGQVVDGQVVPGIDDAANGLLLTAAQPANEIAATLTDWLSEYDMRNPGPDDKRIAARVGSIFLRIPPGKRKAVLDQLSGPIHDRAFRISMLYVFEPDALTGLLKIQSATDIEDLTLANTLYLMPA